MHIKAEEIGKIIEEQIRNYDQHVEMSETGTVMYVGDGIARVYGVRNAMSMELLEFPGGLMGMVLNLEEDNVGVALLGDDTDIKEGDPVKRTGRIFSVPVGPAVAGRVLNPLGQPIDGGKHGNSSRGAQGSRHHAAQERSRTHGHGHQGHRRHHAHRPRTA